MRDEWRCATGSYFLFGPYIQFVKNMGKLSFGAGVDIPAVGWHGVPISTEICGDEYSPRFEAPFFVAVYFRMGFQSIR